MMTPRRSRLASFVADVHPLAWLALVAAITFLVMVARGHAQPVVYVSDRGSNLNVGTNPAEPLLTLRAGHDKAKALGATALILAGTFTDQCIGGEYGAFECSSITVGQPDPALPRARVVITPSSRFQHGFQVSRQDDQVPGVRLVGVEFEQVRDPARDHVTACIQFRAIGEGFTVERVSVRGWAKGIEITTKAGAVQRGVVVRDVLLADLFPGLVNGQAADSHGAYFSGCEGILLERVVVDHTGWRDGWPGGARTQRNQGFYLHGSNTNVVVRECVGRDVAHCFIQMRGRRMDAIDNLVVRCPVGIGGGHGYDFSQGQPRWTGTIEGNVVWGTADVGATGLGWGIVVNNCGDAWIRRNALCAGTNTTDGVGIDIGGQKIAPEVPSLAGVVTLDLNVVHRWRGRAIRVWEVLSPLSVVHFNQTIQPDGWLVLDLADVNPSRHEQAGGTWSSNFWASLADKALRVKGATKPTDDLRWYTGGDDRTDDVWPAAWSVPLFDADRAVEDIKAGRSTTLVEIRRVRGQAGIE